MEKFYMFRLEESRTHCLREGKTAAYLAQQVGVMCCGFTVSTINQEADHMTNSDSREGASNVIVDEEEQKAGRRFWDGRKKENGSGGCGIVIKAVVQENNNQLKCCSVESQHSHGSRSDGRLHFLTDPGLVAGENERSQH